VLPLEPDDPIHVYRIVYLYKANSLYNRRYEQRRRLKELLGNRYRPLVEAAKRRTKTRFLDRLINEEAEAIRRILHVEPGVLWQAAQGRRFLDLPPRMVQLEFDFDE
jgi:hypothetical protein